MKNTNFFIALLIVTIWGCKNKVNETKISEQKLDYEFLIKNTSTLLFTTGHDLNNKPALTGVTLKMIDSTTLSYDFGIQDWKKEQNWKGIAKLKKAKNDSTLDVEKKTIPAFEFQDTNQKIVIKISRNTKLSDSMAQVYKNNGEKLVEISPLLYYK